MGVVVVISQTPLHQSGQESPARRQSAKVGVGRSQATGQNTSWVDSGHPENGHPISGTCGVTQTVNFVSERCSAPSLLGDPGRVT